MHGNIQFRNTTTYGYVYNKLDVACTPNIVGQTHHTFYDFKGRIIDLVTTVTAIFLCPEVTGLSTFLESLATSYGISVVSGEIKKAFTFTLSCIETNFDWQVANSDVPKETKQFTGKSYYINDVKAATHLQGVTQYESYSPIDWKTSKLATAFHSAVYGYAPDEIIGWSPLG